MTTTYTTETIGYAISHALTTTERVNVEVESVDGAIAAVDAAIAAMPGEWERDESYEDDGSVRVWGWTDQTPDNEAEWGLNLVMS